MRPFKKLPGALFRALGHYPTRLRGAALRVDPNHWRFWRKAARGLWEPETLECLAQRLEPQMIVCDIGAWIGPTAIFAARHCSHVYCFEPDTTAYGELLRNLQLNRIDNVTPFNLALAATNGMRTAASFGGARGDSQTSLLAASDGAHGAHRAHRAHDPSAMQVMTLSWARWLELARPPRIDFLKIDIEGGEFDLLPSMAADLAARRPTLLLSTHAPYLAPAEREPMMHRLADALRVYGRCLNERQAPVGVDALLEPAALNRFRTFLFTD
jgi:FkbM family methyltransferase